MTFFLTTCAAFYILGAAVVFGGTCALAFATAPNLFRTLPDRLADRSFGRVLATFDRVGIIAAILATMAAAAAITFGDVDPVLASIPVCLMALIVAVFGFLRGSVAPRMAELGPPDDPDAADARSDEDKAAFEKLHRQYVRMYAINLFASAMALIVVAIQP